MQNDDLISLSFETGDSDEPPGKCNLSQTALEITNKTLLKKSLNEVLKTPPINYLSQKFYEKHFPGTGPDQWNSWQWQIRNSFTSFNQLQDILELSEDEIKPHKDNTNSLPLRITPYYASLLDPRNPMQPLRRTMVPVIDEYIISEGESSDPLSEEQTSPVPNIVHRYPDRVLFLVTGFCSSYCRYCTRSHIVANDQKIVSGYKAWDEAVDYIRNHPEIRDVILSGGDILTLTDVHIEYLLEKLRAIPHVQIIRIGTKVPAVLPQRITPQLLSVIKKYHPIYMSLHFTHPDEITPEVSLACNMLADAGIPLGSQTVLLKGVNDDVQTMTQLMHALLKIRVRPYYIYQCDPILGSRHFRTSVKKGLEIIKGMRGYTSGYAIPSFVVDAPGGGGKIPLLPDYVHSWEEGDKLIFKNYKGDLHVYPDVIID